MDHFSYLHGQLHAESIPLAEIAENVGTPAYVYSTGNPESSLSGL